MADKLIRDFINTAGLPAANDYTATDGATNGTQKRLLLTLVSQVATRAALIALDTTNAGTGQAAIVQGGASPGDGGGGIYYFDSTSAATPNGSTVLQPTTGPGRWLAVPTAFFAGLLPAGTTFERQNPTGPEGAEFQMQTGATSALSGQVAVDLFLNSFRIFENGGASRGVNVDLSSAAASAGSPLMLGDKNLSELTSASTARTNLGLGSVATESVVPVAKGGTGATAPGAAKTNLNLIQVNVRDYGATGDGVTNDGPAISAAVAALPAANSWLYFPPGKYNLASGISDIGNKTNLFVDGDGAELYNTNGSNTLVFEPTCNGVTVQNLRFTGNAVVRGSGIHIRCHADNCFISNNYFQGCSDFGVFIGHEDTGNVCRNAYVEGNIFEDTLGDGVHVLNAENVVVADNVFRNTGDDAIGVVADYSARNPKNITIVGNQIYTPASRGIAVLEAEDVLISGNQIYSASAAGIEVGRYLSTSFYNARIQVEGNKVYNSMAGGVGPRGSIWLNFIQQGACTGNQIVDPAFGAGIVFLDVNEFSISNNFLRGCPQRGIAADDTTTANVGNTWYQVFIANNNIDYTLANEAIYVVPASGKTIENLMVTGNNAMVTISGSFIFYNRITNGRIGNNTSLGGSTISAGGSVTGVTTFNNN